MNEEQKRKLESLKLQNQKHMKELQYKNNVLLQECLSALETYQIISDEKIVYHVLQIVDDCCRENSVQRFMFVKERNYFVVWDNVQVPIIKCTGHDIEKNLDDIVAVAFDTYFVDEEIYFPPVRNSR